MPDILRQQREMARHWGRLRVTIDTLVESIPDVKKQVPDLPYLPRQSLDGMPHGTSVSSPTENLAMAALKMTESFQRAAERMEARLAKAKEEARPWDEAVACLPCQEKKVIRMRYLEWLTADEVALQLGFTSRTSVYNLENRALMNIWRWQTNRGRA